MPGENSDEPKLEASEHAPATPTTPTTPTTPGGMATVVSVSRQIRKVTTVIALLVSVVLLLIRTRACGKGMGEAAFNAEECRSGRILSREGGGRLSMGGLCTKECTADDACGTGFQCFEGNCAPAAGKALGQPCDAPWECPGKACIAAASPLAMLAPAEGATAEPPRTMCSQKCDDGTPCPSGYQCGSDGNESYCVSPQAAPSLADVLQQLQRAGAKP